LKTVVFPDPANPTSPILIDDRTAAGEGRCQYVEDTRRLRHRGASCFVMAMPTRHD
jgi:hypothetical protein